MALILSGSSGSTTLDSSAGLTFSDTSNQSSAASPYVLKNRIINGAMVIDQRNAGASLTITANPQYTVDRWFAGVTNASKISVQQSSTAPAGFTNSMLVTSLAATTPGTNDVYYIQQSIEGYNVADLDFGLATAKTITISFWVRSSLTGTFGAVLLNAGSNRSFPFNYTISTANTWTQVSQTIAGDTTGTWNTTNGTGFQLRFGLGAGSTYQGVAGSWGTTNAVTTTTATNVLASSSNYIYFTGVQLEIGSTATPFERRLYNQELANCQRYYWRVNAQSSYTPYGNGWNASTSAGQMVVKHPVTMRSKPTSIDYSLLSSTQLGASEALVATASLDSTNNLGTDASTISIASSALFTTGFATLTAKASTSSYLGLSAEL
jgi:hypothetical protein